MDRVPELKMTSSQSSFILNVSGVHANSSRNEQCPAAICGSQNSDALVLKESEVNDTMIDQNESMPEVDSFRSVDSFEGGRSSFNGASHPLEPMDTDLVKSVYVAIDQEKSDAGCLMKGISTKGPFIEDLSVLDPPAKTSAAVLVLPPNKMFNEEPDNDAGEDAPEGQATLSDLVAQVQSDLTALRLQVDTRFLELDAARTSMVAHFDSWFKVIEQRQIEMHEMLRALSKHLLSPPPPPSADDI